MRNEEWVYECTGVWVYGYSSKSLTERRDEEGEMKHEIGFHKESKYIPMRDCIKIQVLGKHRKTKLVG